MDNAHVRGMRDARRVLGIVVALGAALVGCSGGAGEDVGSSSAKVTSCAGAETVRGVDVSHWDGAVDWTEVKASGIAFAFAKATEGTGLVDDEFAANWSGMKSAGVVRGAYHFFDASADPNAQATFFVKTVGALGANDLPSVLDFETLNGESEATAVSRAATFLAAVTASTGKRAILYMSAEFLSGSYASLAPYTLWVANYGVSCPGLPSEWARWSFWQSSDSGSVSGISDAVDVDSFNGTLQQLEGLTGGGSGSGGSSGSGSGSSGGSSGGSSSGSSSSGSSGGSSSGGGETCHSSGDCNPGTDGSGLICVSGKCVPGCNASWECPGDTRCIGGMCH